MSGIHMSTADSIALDNMTDFQSEILLEKSLNGKQQPDFNDFDAVLNCVSRMEAVTKLQYKDYHYMINTNSSIEVAKEIYFTLAPQTAEEGKTGIPTKVAYRLHSDSLGIKEIKDYIALCRQEYESQRNNKLGNDICFFDQVTANDNKSHQALSFDKKSFQTFRTFDNVFFEEKPEVEGRVKHFMENKQWYVKRGIPYTLGFMFHGPPGCGKTSTIKAIANVTRRHIFNVRLSELKTNTQLKNLFFNPVVQVVNPETLCVEKFVVPIHQRFYVIEDIDCMTDLIKRRELRPETEDDEEPEPVKKPVKKLVKKPVKKPAQDFLDGDEELQAYYDGALDGEKIDMTRDADSEDARDKITFSDLLNAFDGTNEVQSRMIAFTTNHLEVIDPALIRPGRVDMIIEFKNCTRAIIKQMFESFYEQTFDGAKFSKIKDYKISPASINQVLFKHFTRPDAAIEELSTAANKRKVYKKRDKDTADD